MQQELEQFLAEVPSIIWELEAQGEDWIFTRRYGEIRPTHRGDDLIGRSLYELYPAGHPATNLSRDIM